jgi:hypothetical protein
MRTNRVAARRRRRAVRRRRLAALGVVAAAAAVAGVVVGAGHDGSPGADGSASAAKRPDPPPPPELPRGGRTIFPRYRVVAFYGAPQAAQLGELGIGSPDTAARKLIAQAKRYARPRRPVLEAMELIVTVANRDPGTDGMYRSQQSDAIVRRYLRAARRHKMLLVLDIQPGHADFLDEARHLRRWLRQPDVGIALDPEWHTPGVVPGTQIGSVDATKVNEVATYVADIVRRNRLPQKLFVVHQFVPDMIQGKPAVRRPRGLAMTMNVDGFGTRPAKLSKYRQFTHDGTRFFNGYKLFYHEDTGLMTPRQVLRMRPPPDLVVYE